MGVFRQIALPTAIFLTFGRAALGASATDEALASDLRQAMIEAEKIATAAGFPHPNIVNAVLKNMWTTLYRADPPLTVERKAIDRLAEADLSPIQQEAARRMQQELARD